MMPAAIVDLFARLAVVDRMPFGDDMEVGRDVEQAMRINGRVSPGNSFSVRTRT